MNIEVLQKLSVSRISNDAGFPFWIYKIEPVSAAGRRFLKIYLFDHTFSNAVLNNVVINHQGKEYLISSLNAISDYNDKQIVGGYFETDPGDLNSDVCIIREGVDGKIIEGSGMEISYTMDSFPAYDAYLSEKYSKYRNNHTIFPKITNQYWQCSCGRIHCNGETSCHCGNTYQDIQEWINLDCQDEVLKTFSETPIKYDISSSFEDNIRRHTERYVTRYGFPAEITRDILDLDKEKAMYLAKKRKRRNRILGISAVCAIALISLIMVFVVPQYKLYTTYMKYKDEPDLQQRYIQLSGIQYKDSQDLADQAFKQRFTKFYQSRDYEGMVKMLDSDNSYTTLVESSGKGNYTFHDNDMYKMYWKFMWSNW